MPMINLLTQKLYIYIWEAIFLKRDQIIWSCLKKRAPQIV